MHDARRKFASSLEANVLDYLHYHALQLEECVRTLHTLFSNVVQHPDEHKYRRVRACCFSSSCGSMQQQRQHLESSSKTAPGCRRWRPVSAARAPACCFCCCAERDCAVRPCLLQIKAANKAYLKHVASVKHAEDLMLQAGWRSKVGMGVCCACTCACMRCAHAAVRSMQSRTHA